MFSNIQVENIAMDAQESYNINLLNQVENINSNINMTIRSQSNEIPQNNTNQNNNSNSIGNGVITVIKLLYYILLPINLCILYFIDILFYFLNLL